MRLMAAPAFISRACSNCNEQRLLAIAVPPKAERAVTVEVLACLSCDRMSCPHCGEKIGQIFGRVGPRCEHCGGYVFE
jgi:hypothetical protein